MIIVMFEQKNTQRTFNEHSENKLGACSNLQREEEGLRHLIWNMKVNNAKEICMTYLVRGERTNYNTQKKRSPERTRLLSAQILTTTEPGTENELFC